MVLSQRGQLTIEWIVLLAAVLLVGLLAAGYFFTQQQQFSQSSNEQVVEAELKSITTAADQVFRQGPGASTQVKINLPTGVELSQSGLSGQTAFIQYEDQTIRSRSSVPLRGPFPWKNGSTTVAVESRARYVWVGPVLVKLSQYVVSLSLLPSAEKTQSITVTNATTKTVPVHVLLPPDDNFVSIKSNADSFELEAGTSREVVFTFTASPLAFGNTDTNIIFQVTDGEVTEDLEVPVMIDFESTTPGNGLRFIPGSVSLTIADEGTQSLSVRLCNDSSSLSTGLQLAPSAVFDKSLPLIEGTVWDVAADEGHYYAVTQEGQLFVWLSDFTFLKKVPVGLNALRAIYPSTSRVWVASTDGSVYGLSLDNWTILTELRQNGAAMRDVVADGTFVYAASNDGFIHVWNESTGDYETRLSNSESPVNAVSAKNDYVIFSSDDQNVYVYTKNGFVFQHSLSFESTPISLTETSAQLFVGLQTGEVAVFNKSDFSTQYTLPLSFEPIHGLFADEENGYFSALASTDGIYFLDLNGNIRLHESEGTFMQSGNVANDEYAIAGSLENGVFVFKYAGFDQVVGGQWMALENPPVQIAAHDCAPVYLSVTVPPQMVATTYAGSIRATDAQDHEATWYAQINVTEEE